MRMLGRSDVVFVDVREPEEQAVSIIPGAISQKQFRDAPSSYAGKTIFVYGTISYRSGKLAEEFEHRQIHALNLAGGLLAWVHAGGAVLKDGRPVKRLNVYGRKWDLAPQVFETVY